MRKVKFLTKLLNSGNIVCRVFTDIINRELDSLVSNVPCFVVKLCTSVYNYLAMFMFR